MRTVVSSTSPGQARALRHDLLTGATPTPWKTVKVPTGQQRFLKLTDVAEILNVTTRQVYALVRSGDLRGIQVGGRQQWRVEAIELEDYIKRQYERSQAPESHRQR